MCVVLGSWCLVRCAWFVVLGSLCLVRCALCVVRDRKRRRAQLFGKAKQLQTVQPIRKLKQRKVKVRRPLPDLEVLEPKHPRLLLPALRSPLIIALETRPLQ